MTMFGTMYTGNIQVKELYNLRANLDEKILFGKITLHLEPEISKLLVRGLYRMRISRSVLKLPVFKRRLVCGTTSTGEPIEVTPQTKRRQNLYFKNIELSFQIKHLTIFLFSGSR